MDANELFEHLKQWYEEIADYQSRDKAGQVEMVNSLFGVLESDSDLKAKIQKWPMKRMIADTEHITSQIADKAVRIGDKEAQTHFIKLNIIALLLLLDDQNRLLENLRLRKKYSGMY